MLADSLKLENKYADNTVYSPIDYTSNVNLYSISNNGIGEQMASMYTVIDQVNGITNQVTNYYSAVTQLLDLYKTYFQGQPEIPS